MDIRSNRQTDVLAILRVKHLSGYRPARSAFFRRYPYRYGLVFDHILDNVKFFEIYLSVASFPQPYLALISFKIILYIGILAVYRFGSFRDHDIFIVYGLIYKMPQEFFFYSVNHPVLF